VGGSGGRGGKCLVKGDGGRERERERKRETKEGGREGGRE